MFLFPSSVRSLYPSSPTPPTIAITPPGHSTRLGIIFSLPLALAAGVFRQERFAEMNTIARITGTVITTHTVTAVMAGPYQAVQERGENCSHVPSQHHSTCILIYYRLLLVRCTRTTWGHGAGVLPSLLLPKRKRPSSLGCPGVCYLPVSIGIHLVRDSPERLSHALQVSTPPSSFLFCLSPFPPAFLSSFLPFRNPVLSLFYAIKPSSSSCLSPPPPLFFNSPSPLALSTHLPSFSFSSIFPLQVLLPPHHSSSFFLLLVSPPPPSPRRVTVPVDLPSHSPFPLFTPSLRYTRMLLGC